MSVQTLHGVPIIDWTPGLIVSEPCIVRNAPMDWYHGDCCDGVSVSSSLLRKIVGPEGCLLKAWDNFYMNPDRAPPKDAKYFTFGRALHHLAGGEAEFLKHFAVRPLEFVDYRTNAAKAWKEAVLAEKKGPLTPNDLEALKRCADQLMAHPNIQNGILRGLIEHSLFVKVRVPLTGWPVQEDEVPGFPDGYVDIWLKVRPDVIPLESLVVADLKSAANASPISARRAIGDRGYHLQMAMIDEVLRLLTKVIFEEFILLFIESERPHCINHKPLTTFTMQAGHMQFRAALLKFARAYATCYWPTYDDDEVPGTLLDFTAKEIAKQIEDGALPALDPLEMAPTEAKLLALAAPDESF